MTRGLLARYRAKPGQGDIVERTLLEMAEAVRRTEPGCLVYRAARSTEEPEIFVLYEEYEDEAALLAHRETPHFRTLIEGVVAPVLASREREILAPLLPAPGGASNVGG
ncbi:MAG: putative quinol monooxygenase [Actinomycetota bacterium]